MSSQNKQPNKFYSRFSLQKSQPYLLTHEFDCKGMKIPGMQWIPDFSMWNVNKPNFPSGPPVQFYGNPQQEGCKICNRFSGAACGYEWWTTRRMYGLPVENNYQCYEDSNISPGQLYGSNMTNLRALPQGTCQQK